MGMFVIWLFRGNTCLFRMDLSFFLAAIAEVLLLCDLSSLVDIVCNQEGAVVNYHYVSAVDDAWSA